MTRTTTTPRTRPWAPRRGAASKERRPREGAAGFVASPFIAALLALASIGPRAFAEVRLPHIFSSRMVLQRDMPLPVWGWADPGEEVAVTLGDETQRTRADAAGTWRVTLSPREAGGPHSLRVKGTNEISLDEVLVGEVWLCSGQSNMEMGITLVEGGSQAAAGANDSKIRLLMVPNRPSGQPLSDIDSSWTACSPESISKGGWGGFPAVAYFFARELRRELDVPVGLIDATWGGTLIEPWTPRAGFDGVASLHSIRDDVDRAQGEYERSLLATLPAIEAWTLAARTALAGGDSIPPAPDFPRHSLASERRPTGLYNGMIHALAPFAIRGVLWYQGESNVMAGDGAAYLDKMRALIEGWRGVWNANEMPFYFVQLAPFRYPRTDPTRLAEVWDSQRRALEIPNTGMVVTTDVTNLDDIHPGDKKSVGERLSRWALAKTYARPGIACSGPLFESMSIEDGAVRVRFGHAAGLASRDGAPLSWFEIAGADGRFVKAEARIDGESVVVSSAQVPQPTTVRFGWGQEAAPNLVNGAGLPASPFRAPR
ncbi:MAG: sialate O-acetylesterase [Phycisphaerae bacterium]|nr:sialate O-acetylesterase [Phycisphaerae bacterium]